MLKIDFKNTPVNFFKIALFSKQKKISNYDILKQAYDQGVLLDDNKKLLLDFVNYFKNFNHELKSQLLRIAEHDAYVLMTGESGINKELLARYLHSLSSRSDKPFLTVNVSTLNSENPQKELFGFVTNNQIQEGLLDNATEGTLFINDIGELSMTLQSYFLDLLKIVLV